MRHCIFSILIWTITASAQIQANTPLPPPPIPSPTAIKFPPVFDQPFPEIIVEKSPPTATTTTPENNTSIIGIITAPQTHLPTSATSFLTDTRELSEISPNTPDPIGIATISQEDTATSERTTSSGVVSATANSTTPGDVQNGAEAVKVGGEVAVSACALVVAIAGLTWVFAEF